MSHENPTPLVVPMTDEAATRLTRLSETADDNYDNTKDPVEQVLWTRVYEIACKLALIYACSADDAVSEKGPVIDEPAARWAAEFTDWVIRRMIRLTAHHVADSPFAKLVLRAEHLIRKNGGAMSRRELSRSLRLRPKELDEVIQKMTLDETVASECQEGTGGRARIVYRLSRET